MYLQILKIGDKCTGCGACISACPKNALSLVANEEGFYYPKLDATACIKCHLCDNSCQVLKPAVESLKPQRRYYMAKAEDQSVVKSSSSGGVFSVLANMILAD